MASRAAHAARIAQLSRIYNKPSSVRLISTSTRPLLPDGLVGKQPGASLHARPRRPARSTTTTQTRSFSFSPAAKSTSKYSYRVAASYTAKDVPYEAEKNTSGFDPSSPPQRQRRKKSERPASGQDSFFVSRIGETDDVALGVADGVGGWEASGVDPADFAHGLCEYMARAAAEDAGGEGAASSARALMQKGYEDVCQDASVKAGGSTACVVVARASGQLDVANLGDSGFVQLRLNAVHAGSAAQTHAFNTPYQLSMVPAEMLARSRAFGGQQLSDLPRDADVSRHAVRHGDVLVLASDGVWDNLSAQDVLRLVARLMAGARAWETTKAGLAVGEHLHAFTLPDAADDIPSLQNFLAAGIAGEAKAASVDTQRNGPFAREVQRHYPQEKWRGGKVDDICVVVAIVVEEGR